METRILPIKFVGKERGGTRFIDLAGIGGIRLGFWKLVANVFLHQSGIIGLKLISKILVTSIFCWRY